LKQKATSNSTSASASSTASSTGLKKPNSGEAYEMNEKKFIRLIREESKVTAEEHFLQIKK